MNGSTDKWDRKMDPYENIEILAINRQIFICAWDGCECIFQYFPLKFKQLIILIDPETDTGSVFKERSNVNYTTWEENEIPFTDLW